MVDHSWRWKLLNRPTTMSEKLLVEMAALETGIAPPGYEGERVSLPRETRRKYRKLWRSSAKSLMKKTFDAQYIMDTYFGKPNVLKAKRRAALIENFLVKKVKKECTNT